MDSTKTGWTSAAFRIFSETISAEEISKRVNCQPTRCYAKGERCSKRNPRSSIREENLWILESGLTEQDTVEAHIVHFLSFLKENAEAIAELQPDCEFEVMCAFFSSEDVQADFTIDHKIIKELAAFPVILIVNLYPPYAETPDDD